MPVRFRCSECRSKLSIARRKIGTEVACPTCRQMVTVPTENDLRDEATELMEFGGTATATKPATKAKVEKAAKPVDLEDMPLFERSDFARMLEPAVRDAKVESEQPLPLPTPSYSTPVTTDGILVLRSTVVVLTAAVVVLMGLAFAAGFLMGSR